MISTPSNSESSPPAHFLSRLTDAHCHPTDDPNFENTWNKAGSGSLGKICVMSSNLTNQDWTTRLANTFRDKVIPCYGIHPWFTHLISLADPPPPKAIHYTSLFPASPAAPDTSGSSANLNPESEAHPDLLALLPHLPEPLPLSTVLEELRKNLENHETAMLGEVGLDRSFKIPSYGGEKAPHTMTEKEVDGWTKETTGEENKKKDREKGIEEVRKATNSFDGKENNGIVTNGVDRLNITAKAIVSDPFTATSLSSHVRVPDEDWSSTTTTTKNGIASSSIPNKTDDGTNASSSTNGITTATASKPSSRFTRLSTPLEHQMAVLWPQLEMAVELERNISFHSVRAQEVTMTLLDRLFNKYGERFYGLEPEDPPLDPVTGRERKLSPEETWGHGKARNGREGGIKVDLHSYGGSKETVGVICKSYPNIYFSFSTVINSRSPRLSPLITSIPSDRLLVESDFNSAKGEDLDEKVWEMVKIVGEAKGWDVEETVRILEGNWRGFKGEEA